MQGYLIAAALLAVLVGVVHSVLGELLIFNQLRVSGVIPSLGAPPLRGRNVRILWATWHLASVFGWALAGILLGLALWPDALDRAVLAATLLAFLAGSVLVLIATRGRHPGWMGLGAVALFIYLAGAYFPGVG